MVKSSCSLSLSLVLALSLGALSSVACSSNKAEDGGPKSGSSAAAETPKEAVAKAALVIDVREPEEFAAGHLDKAENIPVGDVQSKVEEIKSKLGGDTSKLVAVYCASGNRAGKTKSMLEKAGFTHVFNAGGYRNLK